MFTDIKKKLLDGSEEERRAAVENLRVVKAPEVMHLLISALGDSSWRVRKTAGEVLEAYFGDEQLVQALITALRSDENAGMRNSAAELLARVGRSAIPSIVKILKDPDRDIRKFGIDILKEIGDGSAVQQLVESLMDSDNNVASSAAEALGRIGGEDAMNALVSVLSKGDLWLRFAALEALGSIGNGLPVEPITGLLHDRILRKAALDALGKTNNPKVVPFMVEALGDKGKGVREAAVHGLFHIYNSLPVEERSKADDLIREKVDPIMLTELLSSPSMDLRRGIVLILGIIGRDSELLNLASVEDLQDAVKDAFVGMGRKGVEVLTRAFPVSDDRMRAYICKLLGVTGDMEAFNMLVKALSDPYGHVRQASALALGRINSPEAIPFLVPLLADKYVDVEEAAVKAIVMLAKDFREQVVRGLRNGMADRFPQLRRNVATILGEIGGADAIPFIVAALKDDHPEVRRAAASALGNLEEGMEHLALALADEDEQVRLAAVHAIGRFHDDEAVRLLILASGDEDMWVRVAAIKGLSKFKSDRAFDAVAMKVADKVGAVAITAMDAVSSMRGKDAVVVLKKGLHHQDRDVVRAAEGLLVKIAD